MDPLTLKLQAQAALIDINNLNDLLNQRQIYLGKNGLVKQMMQQIKKIPSDQRANYGQSSNEVKGEIIRLFEEKYQQLLENKPMQTWFDVTLPGLKPKLGHLHIITQAIEEISTIFEKIGFIRARYPEVEWDYFAFEALNMPKDHPARDEWETLFIDAPIDKKYGKMVLTPHTSSGQVREMLRQDSKPPIRMINIAKCYRRQQDIKHTIMFHQFEGLVVDEGINITHLKGAIDYFVKSFYGESRQARLRPFHFQFTEPSFEIDINCAICLGKGVVDGKKCRTCKQGWMELAGAGMVHPNVLKAGGLDPKKYSGWAFGFGVERVYMMRNEVKIDDIRIIYDNDNRFLEQF